MRAKDIGDENEFVFHANGTRRARLLAEIACGAHELGVRIAHLVLTQTPTAVFVDEVLTCESVVDGAATAASAQRTRTETHAPKASDRRSPVRNGGIATLVT